MRRPLLLLLPALLVLLPGAALAHASVTSVDPADGSRLDEVPATVTVTMSEDVGSGSVLRVLDPEGQRLDQGDPTVDGTTISVDVAPSSATGSFRVVYRVISVDGHPVTGQSTFTIGAAGGSDASSTPTAGAASASPGPTSTDAQGDVRQSSAEDRSDPYGPYLILGFFVIAMGIFVYVIRAGMGSSGSED